MPSNSCGLDFHQRVCCDRYYCVRLVSFRASLGGVVHVSGAKAARELGLTYITMEESVKDMCEACDAFGKQLNTQPAHSWNGNRLRNGLKARDHMVLCFAMLVWSTVSTLRLAALVEDFYHPLV